MRFSGGHDYYDSVLQFGRDSDVFFERAPINRANFIPHQKTGFVIAPPGLLEFRHRGSWRRECGFTLRKTAYLYAPIVVWFAGERYPGVCLTITPPSSPNAPQKEQKRFFWSRDSFLAHLQECAVEVCKEPRYSKADVSFDVEDLHKLFDPKPTVKEVEWMVENRISIAISARRNAFEYVPDSKTGWYINCDGLSSIGFAACLDPYAAYQKLSQWISGVLSGEAKPMVKISDQKVVLQKHGFDKHSFKHRPAGNP